MAAGRRHRGADVQRLLEGLRLSLHPLALPGREHEEHHGEDDEQDDREKIHDRCASLPRTFLRGGVRAGTGPLGNVGCGARSGDRAGRARQRPDELRASGSESMRRTGALTMHPGYPVRRRSHRLPHPPHRAVPHRPHREGLRPGAADAPGDATQPRSRPGHAGCGPANRPGRGRARTPPRRCSAPRRRPPPAWTRPPVPRRSRTTSASSTARSSRSRPEDVDVVERQGGLGDLARHPAVGLDLGVVADAAQQPVGDARRPAGATGDLRRPVVGELHPQQPGAAAQHLFQVGRFVELHLADEAEPVAEGAGEQPRHASWHRRA